MHDNYIKNYEILFFCNVFFFFIFESHWLYPSRNHWCIWTVWFSVPFIVWKNCEVRLFTLYSAIYTIYFTIFLTQSQPSFRYTQPASFTGIPGVVVPFGYDHNNLPIGVQVMTSWWEEHVAFRVAHCLEKGLVRKEPQVYFNILDPNKNIIPQKWIPWETVSMMNTSSWKILQSRSFFMDCYISFFTIKLDFQTAFGTCYSKYISLFYHQYIIIFLSLLLVPEEF